MKHHLIEWLIKLVMKFSLEKLEKVQAVKKIRILQFFDRIFEFFLWKVTLGIGLFFLKNNLPVGRSCLSCSATSEFSLLASTSSKLLLRWPPWWLSALKANFSCSDSRSLWPRIVWIDLTALAASSSLSATDEPSLLTLVLVEGLLMKNIN